MKLTDTTNVKGYIQTIPPAGAGRETSILLLIACIIILISALIVMWRTQNLQTFTMSSYQIDLATELDSNEQGLYTDLQAVYNELQQMNLATPPSVAYWAQDGWPPFVADLSAVKRGAFQWQLLTLNNTYAYWGWRKDTELLWRLSTTKSLADSKTVPFFDVWLRHHEDANALPIAPNSFNDHQLIAHNWRQIVAHSAQLNEHAHSN